MFMETLGEILLLPSKGRKDVPNDFSAAQTWMTIFGEWVYEFAKAKASDIQNLCFRYIQKVLVHTILDEGITPG